MNTTPQKLSEEQQSFINDFKSDFVIASPGRINLIGEHTDYNYGYALPTAIDKKIYFYIKKNESINRCKIYSKNYNRFLEIDLNEIKISSNKWENYVLGVINELKKRTDKIQGFDCIIDSKLPIGAGLSSSAALECGLAYGLNKLFDLQLDKKSIIELSRDAEHSFAGTKCGIMDQFASVMSKENHLILLDCKTLYHTFVSFNINPYKILLLNTNVSHSLVSSEYNTRRNECQIGLKIIQSKYPEITSLGDIISPMLNEFKSEMDPIIYKRCSYILKENARVHRVVQALKNDDLDTFGKLMYASHDGLQNEYNVSCPELDFLVDFSKNNEYILGSRMTGGGFGGCTINIIHEAEIDNYIKKVSLAYIKKFKIELSSILVRPSKGTSVQTISK